MAANYLAVIGDVVQSRRSPDRQELQHNLRLALEHLNRVHRAALAARFTLTLGDEFQGLLGEVAPLAELLAALRAALHPVELRFGLGIGELATALQPEAIGMDGPCFHRARRAIERARERRTPVEAESELEQRSLAIYSLLYGELRRRWTDRQRQVHDLAASGLAGRDIASRLEISPSAVSQHLQAVGHRRLAAATEGWLEALAVALEHDQSEGAQP